MCKKQNKQIKLHNICKTNRAKIILNTCSIYLVKAPQRLEVVVLAEVQHQREQAEDLSVEAELQEEPVVVLPHAVIDPGGEGRTTLKPPKRNLWKIFAFQLNQLSVHLVCGSLTRDSGGPFCARSGRSGCSGASVWAAWDCTCCTAPSAAALPTEEDDDNSQSGHEQRKKEDVNVVLLRVHFLFPHLTEVCEGRGEDGQDPLWRLGSAPQSRGPTLRNNLPDTHTFTHGYKSEPFLKVGGIKMAKGCGFNPRHWGSRD